MTTMYIAANHTMSCGCFLGDVITMIKAAWCFIQNEPHDRIILSLHDDPLVFLWNRFIRENGAEAFIEDWPIHEQHTRWDERRTKREVHGIEFECYKELYSRCADGGTRQGVLCGCERGLCKIDNNVVEYYCYGQETIGDRRVEDPRSFVGTRDFGNNIIDMPQWSPPDNPSIFIAPWEKCHRNAVFTPKFWVDVINGLTSIGINVTINDNRGLIPASELIRVVFPSFPDLLTEMSSHSLILCGNTGPGWVAGAGEYPLIAAEKPDQAFSEYCFGRNGFRSLKYVVQSPDAYEMLWAVIRALHDQKR